MDSRSKLSIKKIASALLLFIGVFSTVLVPIAVAAPVRGVAGDTWADIVLGKPDFNEIAPFSTVGNRLWLPHGVFVDRSNPADQKIYIYDAGNSRILGFDLEDCRASVTDPWNCEPEIVLGQPDFTSSACNGDSAFQNYPDRAPASASSLCGLEENSLSPSEGGSGSSMDIDADGNLYTVDFWNHRVLKYNDPFNTDSVADEVWGQTDFIDNTCNQGGVSPTASTLCFSWGDSNNWTAGVDIDSHGNLWVVDSGNNRALRFPNNAGTISKTADLVLGQDTFTTRDPGTGLDQMYDPNTIRVTDSDEVYITEQNNDRVMLYTTLTNGAAGVTFGSGFDYPSGLDFDPTEPGRLWIFNQGHSLWELWDLTSETKIRDIGLVDNGNVLGDTTGSLGVDINGNLYAATGIGDYNNSVIVFDDGEDTQLPTHTMFSPSGTGNFVDQYGLGSGRGVAVTDDQVIVADQGRILFWNTPNGLADLSNGKAADGYLYASGFGLNNDTGCCLNLKTDEAGHLYTTRSTFGVDTFGVYVYDLPLTSGAAPTHEISFPFNLLGGGTITDGGNPAQDFSDIVPNADGTELWFSHRQGDRVFRVRNPLTAPVVDVILGQANSTAQDCNRGGSEAANTMCSPGALTLDADGNLYVADNWLEADGNNRLLKFNAATIPSANGTILYGPNADLIIDDIATWQSAIDARGKFVVGYNPYWTGTPFTIADRWFPGIYLDMDASDGVPDDHLSDYYSMAFGATFDAANNLYVADLNRGRMLVYLSPLGPTSPLLTTVTPVPTPSNDTTPSFTFNTTEAGLISYGGACTSATTVATAGNNTITFNPLPNGTYTDCTITVTDAFSYVSNTLTVNTFRIGDPAPAASSSNSSAAPANDGICRDGVPVGTPDLFQINRSGKDATLYFTPVKDNTNNYHVIYGHQNGQELYGALSEPVSADSQTGVQHLTIHQLNQNAEYWFKVAPVNGCAVGEWSTWLQTKRVTAKTSIFYKYFQQARNALLR